VLARPPWHSSTWSRCTPPGAPSLRCCRSPSSASETDACGALEWQVSPRPAPRPSDRGATRGRRAPFRREAARWGRFPKRQEPSQPAVCHSWRSADASGALAGEMAHADAVASLLVCSRPGRRRKRDRALQRFPPRIAISAHRAAERPRRFPSRTCSARREAISEVAPSVQRGIADTGSHSVVSGV
jgi:hypothetical protein